MAVDIIALDKVKQFGDNKDFSKAFTKEIEFLVEKAREVASSDSLSIGIAGTVYGYIRSGKNLDKDIHAYAMGLMKKKSDGANEFIAFSHSNVVYIGPKFLARDFFETILKAKTARTPSFPYAYMKNEINEPLKKDDMPERVIFSGQHNYRSYIVATNFQSTTRFIPFAKDWDSSQLSSITKDLEKVEKISEKFGIDHLDDIGFVCKEDLRKDPLSDKFEGCKEEPEEEEER